MSEPQHLPRAYTQAEESAFRRISRQLWGQPYKTHRGPPWFATGNWWPEELLRKALAAEADAHALRIAADALRREIAATKHLFADEPEP